MFSIKIITITCEQSTYRLRRVQPSVVQKADVLEEVSAAFQACGTETELLDFYFTTDYPVNEAFILLFEKRMHELQLLSH